MKSIKLFFISLFCLTCSCIYSQSTTYKGVSVGRGVCLNDYKQYSGNSSFKEEEYFCISNHNDCPATVRIQYKVGSREGAWIDYVDSSDHSSTIDVAPNKCRTCRVGEKIYGLKITYVHLDCSEEVRKVVNSAIQAWEAAGQRKEDNKEKNNQ